jgi:hypothetical protein
MQRNISTFVKLEPIFPSLSALSHKMSPFFGHFSPRRRKPSTVAQGEKAYADKKRISQRSAATATSDREIERKHDSKHDSAIATSSFFSNPGHEPDLLGRLFWKEPRPVVQTSLFFRLPAELRNQIYELVFLSQDYTTDGTLIPSSQSIRNLGLLFTCRQIYAEAIAMAYSVTCSTTNRWHAADLKDMHVQLARLSGGLDEGGDALAAEAVALIRLRNLEFASHLRRPYWTRQTNAYGEESAKPEFMETTADYAKFVYTVLALWPNIETITIWKDEPAISFTSRLEMVLGLPASSPCFEEDHTVLCSKSSHEECEKEAGMWIAERSDILEPPGTAMEAGFWIVRKKNGKRRVAIKCKRSP